MIVEDNVELRNYLRDELKKDYKVLLAENGQIGLDIALEKLPDLILTEHDQFIWVVKSDLHRFNFSQADIYFLNLI